VFAPFVDGYVLPEDVYTIFSKGKQNDVPILVGSNADEGTTLPVFPLMIPPELKPDYNKLYPPGKTANETAGAMLWVMRTWARMETKTGTHKAFEYYFSRVVPYPPDQKFNLDTRNLGAHHGSEISYVFNNLDIRKARNWPWTKEDYALADMMSSYWVNFASTGNPNGPGLPVWPVFTEKDLSTMVFDKVPGARPMPNLEKLRAFDAYFTRQRRQAGATGL